jgi:hypothetical protein
MGRRSIAELKKFYRAVMQSDAPLADKMRAAGRLAKLYEQESVTAKVPVAKPVTKEAALALIAAVNKEKN